MYSIICNVPETLENMDIHVEREREIEFGAPPGAIGCTILGGCDWMLD